jgi:tRNA pseudouridine55 synthase
MAIQGALIIDKSAGMTSHDVVARVRRILKTRRVGHAGTLDPFATGVLVVCVGAATRLTQFLVGLDKQYGAVIRLGYATDTHDGTGKPVTPVVTSNTLRVQDIAGVLEEFVGPQLQVPPMYSAKKVGGQRLYRAAREGREVDRPASRIDVYSLSLDCENRGLVENSDGTKDCAVRIHCSSGTYIRRLAHDIGVRLELGAHLVELRRESVGPHRLDRAVALDTLESVEDPGRFLLSPADAISHMPMLVLTEDEAARVRNGREVELDAARARLLESEVLARLCDSRADLVAVGEVAGSRSVIRPKMVLPP